MFCDACEEDKPRRGGKVIKTAHAGTFFICRDCLNEFDEYDPARGGA
jgi:hypothetical protein